MPFSADIQIETAVGIGLKVVAQMVIRRPGETRARFPALDERIEHVVGADLQICRIKRLASVVVQYDHEAAELIVLERFHDVGGVLDGDRRALFGDLEIVAAVGISLDTLAEEERDARIVDALIVAIPVAVAAKRNLSRFDSIET